MKKTFHEKEKKTKSLNNSMIRHFSVQIEVIFLESQCELILSLYKKTLKNKTKAYKLYNVFHNETSFSLYLYILPIHHNIQFRFSF